MRKTVLICVACSVASLVFAAAGGIRPLQIKTGLWEITETINWTGLPAEMPGIMPGMMSRTYQSCVRAKDRHTNPWAAGLSDKCTWMVLHSDGRELEVQGTSCDFGKEYGMKANVHGEIHVVDPKNGSGSMDVTLTGRDQTINGRASYAGKWIGKSCPAN